MSETLRQKGLKDRTPDKVGADRIQALEEQCEKNCASWNGIKTLATLHSLVPTEPLIGITAKLYRRFDWELNQHYWRKNERNNLL